MGFDMMASVYRHNKETNQYEKMAFYDKNGKELYDIFPTRDGMLNQLLVGYNRHGYDFEAIGARRGLPKWYVEILEKKHPDWFDDSDDMDEGTYYDYLELRGWAQGDACNHKDWEAMEELDDNDTMSKPPMRNALKGFMEKVNTYLDAYNVYEPKPGEIIIICEMSY